MKVALRNSITLFGKQAETLRVIAQQPRFADFSEMGAGKSLPQAILAKGVLDDGICDRVIIVCPKVVLGEWLGIFRDFIDCDWKKLVLVYHGLPTKYRSMVTLRPIVITTYENMVADFDRFQNLFKRERIMLVFDEAHRIRTPGMRKVDRRGKIKWEGSHRTWCATELAWMSTRLYLLTGSPIVNGIKNAFSYINMLRPGQYYQSFHHFQVKHMVFSRDDSRLLLAYKDVNIVEEIIASLSIRHMKRDIHDLPEVTIRPRYLDWDPKQKKLYKDLQTTGVLEREGNFLEPKGAGAMLTRLHQILTNPRQLGFDCDSTRFTMLDDDLESIGLDEHKVVVFAHYRHTVRTLVEKYKHLNPAIIYGGTDDFEGEKLKFNEDPTCRLLIANPISAGIGINLTVSSYAIFFEYSYDLDMFDQAVSRLDRPGQKKAVTIIMYAIRGSMEDRKIIPRLISKKAFSTSLLRDPIEFLRFIDLDEFAEFQEAA